MGRHVAVIIFTILFAQRLFLHLIHKLSDKQTGDVTFSSVQLKHSLANMVNLLLCELSVFALLLPLVVISCSFAASHYIYITSCFMESLLWPQQQNMQTPSWLHFATRRILCPSFLNLLIYI